MTERAPDAWLVSLPYYGVDTQGNHVGKHTITLRHPAWNPGVDTHNAEPLYTIPNALRAIVNGDGPCGDIYNELAKAFANRSVLDLVDELENPEPPILPEPEGDVVVITATDARLQRIAGWWYATGTCPLTWKRAWEVFGPLKVYRAES